jgi:mannosyltransferase OCH1-like enzyme
VIHLIAAGKYQDKNNWPSIWEKCYKSIQQLNYQIKIWNNEEIDNELKSDDIDFYKNYLDLLDPIYKWDYIRYIILKKYGGIYMDLDVEVKVNFIEWLNPSKIYLAEGEHNCLVNNHIMISPPEYNLWNNIQHQLKYKLISIFNKAKTNPYYTLETVGPIGLSYILAKEKYPYTPLSRYHFGNRQTHLQFCIHHTSHTWTEGKSPPYKSHNIK